MKTVNRQEVIPKCMRGQNLAGLGDLVDDYAKAVLDLSDAYSWLQFAGAKVNATGAPTLIQSWKNLIQRGEIIRADFAKYHLEPSVLGFVDNLFGGAFHLPGMTVATSQMQGLVFNANTFISDVGQLKLALQQYQQLVKSGVSPTEASASVEAAQQTFFDKVGGAVGGALKFGGISVIAIAVIAGLVVFGPELKALFHSMKGRGK